MRAAKRGVWDSVPYVKSLPPSPSFNTLSYPVWVDMSFYLNKNLQNTFIFCFYHSVRLSNLQDFLQSVCYCLKKKKLLSSPCINFKYNLATVRTKVCMEDASVYMPLLYDILYLGFLERSSFFSHLEDLAHKNLHLPSFWIYTIALYKTCTLFIWYKVSCRLGWPWLHYAPEDNLEHLILSPLPPTAGLLACTTTPDSHFIFISVELGLW